MNTWVKKEYENEAVLSSDTEKDNGIEITIHKEKKSISVRGWYETYAATEEKEISLEELFKFF